MKRLFFSCFILLISFYNIFSQQRTAVITFSEESFDFGKIKESDGPVTHVFNFTNTGTIPLVINDASPSCGCTTPEWTRQPVMPGAKGFIKATFDPAGSPGIFDKTITVASNASRPTIVLKITGSVIARPLTVMDEYRFPFGDLRAKTSYVFFGKLSPSAKRDTFIDVINNGKQPLTVNFPNLPAMVRVEPKPAVLKPGQKGRIVLSYDAVKKNDWGFLIDYIKFSVNGKADAAYQLTVAADIQEDFSKMTPAQLAKAPVLKFENVIYDFKTVKQGQKVEYEFKYMNAGKSDLIFRKFEPSCNCTTVSSLGMVTKPGTSGSLKVVFDSSGKKNRQNRTITIVSNDPKSPRIMLRVTGMVE